MEILEQTSIESLDVMEFLRRYLQRSSRLTTMYRDYQELVSIQHRAESLSSTLKNNERSCSVEELDTVAEIITGNPSHQSVIQRAHDLAESAKHTFIPQVKAMLKEYKGVLNDARSYFVMLIPSSKTTTSDSVKITNFVDGYPKINYSVNSDTVICGCSIETGNKSISSSFEDFDKVLHDFCEKINSVISQVDNILNLDSESTFVEQHSKVVDHIPCMENACIQLMKYRELLKSFLEGNSSSITL